MIPLLWDTTPGHISKGTKSGYNIDTYIPMFIAALFSRAKLWKQSRCPTSDEWIKNMWYIYMFFIVYIYT
jgi:hypothetical protein